MSPLTGAAIQAVSPQKGGLASGVTSTTRQIGAVLGVAVLGAVVRGRQSGGASFGAGLGTAFTLAGAVTLVSAAFTALFLVRSRLVTTTLQERRNSLPARSAGEIADEAFRGDSGVRRDAGIGVSPPR